MKKNNEDDTLMVVTITSFY